MDLSELIAELSRPAAYPVAVDGVDVRQTHISVVFLAGQFAYKLKKPVQLSFLDFSTLELREKICRQEVQLNRRLAPDVYLGVVPISRTGTQARFEGDGTPIEWAVKMRRLPEQASLEARLERGELAFADVSALARRLALFHQAGETNARISSFGRFEPVTRNLRENFEVAAPQVDTTVSRGVFERLRQLTEQALAEHRPLIDARAQRGCPRDTHGDLHLDHVYLFPDRPPPNDLIAVDCIEFNDRFRYTDPVADMAFLAMDLQFHGRWDLARSFCEEYFAATGDVAGRALLPLYLSYRAAVRGKVDGLQLDEPEIPLEARQQALQRGRGHWLLALWNLAPPRDRPCLLLVGGLPGTGKSTLARQIAGAHNLHIVRSDVVRKELPGLPRSGSGSVADPGVYTREWTDRTYAKCLRRAEELLFEGQRVLVDATFTEEARRRTFLEAARRWGVPGLFVACQARAETVKSRLAARHGDASDADWNVYRQLAQRWEQPTPETRLVWQEIPTDAESDPAASLAVALRRTGLAP